MFDVRFSNDSVLERCFKAAQFGIMTGSAITGSGYQTGFNLNTSDAVLALSAFQTLSLILIVSRLILTAQYGAALMWLKDYKKGYSTDLRTHGYPFLYLHGLTWPIFCLS